jgi:hypothetical protein
LHELLKLGVTYVQVLDKIGWWFSYFLTQSASQDLLTEHIQAGTEVECSIVKMTMSYRPQWLVFRIVENLIQKIEKKLKI